MNQYDGNPIPGSKASIEIKSASCPESIVTAISISILLTEYSNEHLVALRRLLNEPVVPLASWTCVRSMLESSAISAWLMEPNIDSKERIARQFAHRYEGLNQSLKFAKSANIHHVKITEIESRINEVEKDAISLGYNKISDIKGKRCGIGCKMPNATNIIEAMLGREKDYRLFSAVAHGHIWAQQQLAYQYSSSVATMASINGVNIIEHEKHVTIESILYIIMVSITSAMKSSWNLWNYMGWDLVQLNDLFDNTFKNLKIRNKLKFW